MAWRNMFHRSLAQLKMEEEQNLDGWKCQNGLIVRRHGPHRKTTKEERQAAHAAELAWLESIGSSDEE